MTADRDAVLAKAKNAVTDEFGSRACYWPFGGGPRVCTLQIGPQCRCEQIAHAVLEAIEYPSDIAALRRRVAQMETALRWAVPLAKIAMEDHRQERLRYGHKFGTKRIGLYDEEVAKIEAAEAALSPSPPAEERESGT